MNDVIEQPKKRHPTFTEDELRVLYDDERTMPWQKDQGYDARRSALKKLHDYFNEGT